VLSNFNCDNETYILLTVKDVGKKRLVKKIKELDLFKEHMISSFSHDLKTPLNYITGTVTYLQTLAQHDVGCIRPSLENIKLHSDLLFSMINNILDYSNIKNKNFYLEIKPVNIEEILSNLIMLFETSAKDKNLELSYNIDPSIERIIINDGMRIKQIMINLLTNSIKFTNKGFVRLSCIKHSDDMVQFSVEDSGDGFDVENMVSFNTKSPKIKGSHERYRHGIGFGLAVVRELVTRIGRLKKFI
jgi:signal transduction histidine kinase